MYTMATDIKTRLKVRWEYARLSDRGCTACNWAWSHRTVVYGVKTLPAMKDNVD